MKDMTQKSKLLKTMLKWFSSFSLELIKKSLEQSAISARNDSREKSKSEETNSDINSCRSNSENRLKIGKRGVFTSKFIPYIEDV